MHKIANMTQTVWAVYVTLVDSKEGTKMLFDWFNRQQKATSHLISVELLGWIIRPNFTLFLTACRRFNGLIENQRLLVIKPVLYPDKMSPWADGSSAGRKGGGQRRGYSTEWNQRNTALNRWFRWKPVSWWGEYERQMRLRPPTSDHTLQLIRGSLTDIENLWLIWPAPVSPPLRGWGDCFKIEYFKIKLIFCLSYKPYLHLHCKDGKIAKS